MNIKAYNNFVILKREDAASEINGLSIPGVGQKKPARGVVVAIGKLVADPDLKKAKDQIVAFHEGVGWPIEHEGIEYLVLQDREVIFGV